MYDLKVSSLKLREDLFVIQWPSNVIPLFEKRDEKVSQRHDLRALPANYYKCVDLDASYETLPDGNEIVASVKRCGYDAAKEGGFLCMKHLKAHLGTGDTRVLHQAYQNSRDTNAEHIDAILKAEARALNGVEVEKVVLVAKEGLVLKIVKGVRMKADPKDIVAKMRAEQGKV